MDKRAGIVCLVLLGCSSGSAATSDQESDDSAGSGEATGATSTAEGESGLDASSEASSDSFDSGGDGDEACTVDDDCDEGELCHPLTEACAFECFATELVLIDGETCTLRFEPNVPQELVNSVRLYGGDPVATIPHIEPASGETCDSQLDPRWLWLEMGVNLRLCGDACTSYSKGGVPVRGIAYCS